MDTDQQARQKFLEESREYFEQMEHVLLDLPEADNTIQHLNVAMRAAHSLKGGASMMGFMPMAQVAHRLEDFFKILRARNIQVDTELETLLLQGVDSLKDVQQQLSDGLTIDEPWMTAHVEPVIERLRQRLGDLSEADENRLLCEEENVDMAVLVFNSGVEEALDAFEADLDSYQGELLRQALHDQAIRLGELGLMGGIDAFVSLCQSVNDQAQMVSLAQLPELRDQALSLWRRSQSLVQLGRIGKLPTQLNFVPDPALETAIAADGPAALESTTNAETLPAVGFDLDLDNIALETLQAELAEAAAYALESIEPTPPLEPIAQSSASSQPLAANAIVRAPRRTGTLRVAAAELNQINDLFSNLILERNAINLHQRQLDKFAVLLQERMQNLEAFNVRLRQWYDRASMENLLPMDTVTSNLSMARMPARMQNGSYSTTASQDFDALEMDQYSELHLMAQEQMETIVKLQEVTADIRLGLQEMGQSTQALNGTTRQLQTRITRTQMRPLSDIVSRFPRLIRD
ncbi:MAG: hypothetical protein F6K19_34855, partial [Cyanothece sp. SIO1E1]|nr:hypothetical protein [Cyanothece sp. SIO1E1]